MFAPGLRMLTLVFTAQRLRYKKFAHSRFLPHFCLNDNNRKQYAVVVAQQLFRGFVVSCICTR